MGKETKRSLIWHKTCGLCWYCGKALQIDTMCIEHRTPVSRGGSHEIHNLLPACRSCNSQKGNKTLEEYRAWLEWMQVGCEPFTNHQIAWLITHGIELPLRPRYYFFGETLKE